MLLCEKHEEHVAENDTLKADRWDCTAPFAEVYSKKKTIGLFDHWLSASCTV